jgi:cell wall-associated NlpC family hydrolase
MTDGTAAIASAATRWALARVGDRSYTGRCLAFVEDAIERPNEIEVFGGSSARESAELYELAPLPPDTPPPAGSLVFYACEGPADGAWRDWGHVGISLGDGRIVHAWDEVRVDGETDVEQLPPRAGWTAPTLIGWVPLSRVLVGHRPRQWIDG